MLCKQQTPPDQHLAGNTAELDGIISDLSKALGPRTFNVQNRSELTDEGSALLSLRVGKPQSAEFVRDTLLRLEFMRSFSPDTFQALSRFFYNQTSMSEWHATNCQTYRLGTVHESQKFAAEKRSRMMSAFLDGMGSILNLGGSTTTHKPYEYKNPRIEFLPHSGVREIFLSTIRENGSWRHPEVLEL